MHHFIVFCGEYLIVFSVLAICFLLYKVENSKRKKFAFQLLLGGVLALVFARIATQLYDNPRPFMSDGVEALLSSSGGNGFPSDHTLLASFLGFSALLYSRKIGALLLVLAILVGWGRVAGGVHHGVDVVASFLIAGIAVLITNRIVDKYCQKIAKPPQTPKQKNTEP